MKPAASIRWLRIAAIATAAVILASCRSLTAPVLVPAATAIVSDERVLPAGLEAPCPPLPRLGLREPRCRDCDRCGGPPAACGPRGCEPAICAPPPAVPIVGPCFVCDGGDHGAPARPAGDSGLDNLTAGDTVARYRPADREPPYDEADTTAEVHVATSNCTCVYAPRFSSVRQIVRPHVDAAPLGPEGIVADAHVDAAVDTLPVMARTHRLVPEHARKAQPGLAIEERLPPLAVDQADLPEASTGRETPVERALDTHPALARSVQTPRIKVGFDVPLAWTCVKGAQVMVGGQAAEVIAADQGTATLRLEEPGRCELTLCKRAGSDTARVGEELDFTIFLLNSGDRALADIVLVDALPKRLALVPRSAASSLPAEIDADTGDDGSVVVRWRLTETLAPGEGGFVRFRTIVR